MSFISIKKSDGSVSAETMEQTLTVSDILNGKALVSEYHPDDTEAEMLSLIKKHFTLAYVTAYTPRVEFNDLCVIDRLQVDQMSFNTYQPNNGQPAIADDINGWRSNAIRPIVRNKCMSIAAHATANLIFPKVFAYNETSDEQQSAAQVMRDLIEWASDKANYPHTSLRAVLTALTDPASIVYTEYGEVKRKVKREKKNGKYVTEDIMDETLSGFKDVMVPADELYIENFYEPDIQKQNFLIWRRVYSYALAEAKYANLYPDKFKYVQPGVQILYNDANQSFYQVYDTNMRSYDVEEVIYWNRQLDVKIIVVNGVMLTDYDNANPRNDKMYPFAKFVYEDINNRCFYGMSLAFKLQQDANIANTLYQMIIDGTYLNVMPAMVNVGGETIESNVVIPGAVTTLSDTNADLRVLQTSNPNGLQAGLNTLMKIDQSLADSSQDPLQAGQSPQGSPTATEIAKIDQNSNTVLELFIKSISDFVRQYGYLRMGDILQYLTIADVSTIESNPKLVYKTFLMHDKQSEGKIRSRKIAFDSKMSSEPMTDSQKLSNSYDILKEQGGKDSNMELYKVNPELFRNLTYMLTITPDVMSPMSESLERAYMLEEYDRAIQNPLLDQEQITKDFLLAAYPKSKRDPDKYFKQPSDVLGMVQNQAQNPLGAMMPGSQGGAQNTPVAPAQAQARQNLGQNPNQNQTPQMPAAGNSPLNAMRP